MWPWTTKPVLSRWVFAPSDSRFSNNCISTKYYLSCEQLTLMTGFVGQGHKYENVRKEWKDKRKSERKAVLYIEILIYFCCCNTLLAGKQARVHQRSCIQNPQPSNWFTPCRKRFSEIQRHLLWLRFELLNISSELLFDSISKLDWSITWTKWHDTSWAVFTSFWTLELKKARVVLTRGQHDMTAQGTAQLLGASLVSRCCSAPPCS